uniref:Actin nucleation-promoting factor WASL n=2 Tax=Iconisemion striatum TaxID=60296 RepID=A0A1A7WTC7_9TELE
MNSHPPSRRAVNVGSLLLTPQENECLFGYLGRKCATLCSAVVQVYVADRSYNWVKRGCGVACLVKDNPQRSYFIRVFDIKEGKTMFEQELYHNFISSSSRPYFISFAGDNCQIGLNFASEEEAKRFRVAIHDLLNRRQRKTEKRGDLKNGLSLPMATVDIKNPEINNVRHHSSHSHQQPYHLNNMLSHSRTRRPKARRKKLTKADIGTPSNFQHIGHVGWDPNTGFDLNNLDPELKHLFDMCGISEAQLKDRETSKVIYDFIEKKEVDCVSGDSPNSPCPGGKSALLEQIRGGTQLKKVEQNHRVPASSTGRAALLDQIRQGIQLKTVSDPESGNPTPAPATGIVGALMEVMQKRSKAIHSSDEDEDDDEEEDFEDDDEWDD